MIPRSFYAATAERPHACHMIARECINGYVVSTIYSKPRLNQSGDPKHFETIARYGDDVTALQQTTDEPTAMAMHYAAVKIAGEDRKWPAIGALEPHRCVECATPIAGFGCLCETCDHLNETDGGL